MLGFCTAVALLAAPAEFGDLGVGAPVAEMRTLVTATDARGHGLAVVSALDLSPRGYLLVTDLDTGDTQQYPYPEGVGNGPVFVSLLSRNGRWYGVAGAVLLEFDLNRREFTFHGTPSPAMPYCTGYAMADGPDGRVYIGLGGRGSRLVAYDPTARTISDLGLLDEAEHYFTYLAFDAAGWAYAGIGTARQNLVAYHPPTRERRQLVAEDSRQVGTASAIVGTDGQVYGQAMGRWYRLSGGLATEVKREQVAATKVTGVTGYGAMTMSRLADGRRVTRYDTEQRRVQLVRADGSAQTIPFDYQSGGAELTSLVAGPDGRIYASSAHPMHFVAYDPRADKLADLGPVPRVGGGNFCSMAAQGPLVVAGAYSGGWFFAYDPRQPFNGGAEPQPNPRLLAQYREDIDRPRATLAHPDGQHVIMAGYAGYGLRGGGLGIYNLATGTSTLLKHTEVIPEQSTIALEALPNGDIVGGTAIDTPGGGHPVAKEAVCYVLDWATRKVVYQTAPWPGAGAVVALRLGSDGLVYGVTNGGGLFVLDPQRRQIVHKEALSGYGAMVRHGLQRTPDGWILGLFSQALVRLNPQTFAHRKLATPPRPITAGGALLAGRAYYASGARVGSWAVAR